VELRQLEHFVAAAETGHFTRAAGCCHISQSALSTSIRSLERELGSPLFTRTTRRVELTEAGRTLLDEARRTLAAATSAQDAVLAAGPAAGPGAGHPAEHPADDARLPAGPSAG
jgi:DNA-binding transcriptional LysR family regulator